MTQLFCVPAEFRRSLTMKVPLFFSYADIDYIPAETEIHRHIIKTAVRAGLLVPMSGSEDSYGMSRANLENLTLFAALINEGGTP